MQIGGGSQTAALIYAQNGNVNSYWPTGWSGGLGTRDISCAMLYYSTYNVISDIRIKQDITDYTRGLNEILQMRPVSFTWKANPEYGTQYGFIAQEMEEIIPEFVQNDSEGFKSIKSGLVPVYVNAIQEIKQQLDAALAQLN
jgi:hypothetical protein